MSMLARNLASRSVSRSVASTSSMIRTNTTSRRMMSSDGHGEVDLWPKTKEESRKLYGYSLTTLAIFLGIAASIYQPRPDHDKVLWEPQEKIRQQWADEDVKKLEAQLRHPKQHTPSH